MLNNKETERIKKNLFFRLGNLGGLIKEKLTLNEFKIFIELIKYINYSDIIRIFKLLLDKKSIQKHSNDY